MTGALARRRISWAGVFAALALLVCSVQFGPGRAAAGALFRDPEKSYTELYFRDPASLPRTVVPDQPVAFGFFIANRTSKRQSYAWSSSATAGSVTVAGSRGITVLDPGASQLNQASVRIPATATATRASVSVALPANHERISFWTGQDGRASTRGGDAP